MRGALVLLGCIVIVWVFGVMIERSLTRMLVKPVVEATHGRR